MKKNLLIVGTVIGLLMMSFVSAGLWDTITGNVASYEKWGWSYCTTNKPCSAAEGDCDKTSGYFESDKYGKWGKSTQCLSGWCNENVGQYYGVGKSVDVCGCRGEQVELNGVCTPIGSAPSGTSGKPGTAKPATTSTTSATNTSPGSCASNLDCTPNAGFLEFKEPGSIAKISNFVVSGESNPSVELSVSPSPGKTFKTTILPGEIKLTSPDGTLWNCWVNNAGTFSCTK
ncbi:MAG: hypothetical protein ABIA78_03745 [archaeon]